MSHQGEGEGFETLVLAVGLVPEGAGWEIETGNNLLNKWVRPVTQEAALGDAEERAIAALQGAVKRAVGRAAAVTTTKAIEVMMNRLGYVFEAVHGERLAFSISRRTGGTASRCQGKIEEVLSWVAIDLASEVLCGRAKVLWPGSEAEEPEITGLDAPQTFFDANLAPLTERLVEQMADWIDVQQRRMAAEEALSQTFRPVYSASEWLVRARQHLGIDLGGAKDPGALGPQREFHELHLEGLSREIAEELLARVAGPSTVWQMTDAKQRARVALVASFSPALLGKRAEWRTAAMRRLGLSEQGEG